MLHLQKFFENLPTDGNYVIPWDLIKLFKYHYFTSPSASHCEKIIKFMIFKTHLELLNQDPEEKILPEIWENYNPAGFAVDNSESLISRLFKITQTLQRGGEEVKVADNFYLDLDIPDYSDIFTKLEGKPDCGKILLKEISWNTGATEYWYQQAKPSDGLDKVS